MMAVYDDTAAIGKLYRRQDEIGTPWCVTVDVDSLEDGAVTIRDRDSMTQERVPVEGVKRAILDRMEAARAGLTTARPGAARYRYRWPVPRRTARCDTPRRDPALGGRVPVDRRLPAPDGRARRVARGLDARARPAVADGGGRGGVAAAAGRAVPRLARLQRVLRRRAPRVHAAT